MRFWSCVILVAVVLTGPIACLQAPPEPPPPPLAILAPGPEEALGPEEVVEITFNLPMPAEIVVELEPDVQVSVTMSEDKRTVLLSPVPAWAYGTDYVVTISGLPYHFAVRAKPEVTVFAGGDILLDKRPGEQIKNFGPGVVFRGLQDVLDGADIRFANLENPISLRGAPVQKNFRFRSPPETVDALASAGFDVLSFTNNHTFDFGEEAVLDTMEYLSEAGIRYVGVGLDRAEALAPVVLEKNGLRIAFLAFMQRTILPAWSPSLWEAGENKSGVVFLDGEQGRETILNAVKDAQSVADIVLVSLH